MSRRFHLAVTVRSRRTSPPLKLFWISGLISLLGICANISASAQQVQSVQQVVVPLNKSVTLTVPASFSSAVVGSPDIADTLPMTDRTLLIQAKKIGTTNVSIY